MENTDKARENGEATGLGGVRLTDRLGILHSFAEVAKRFNPGFANYE